MRVKRAVSLPLVALATAAAFAAMAPAVSATRPSVAVKTVVTLPGGRYPWVVPVWVTRGGVTLPQLPALPSAQWTQPPAWIPI